MNTTVLREMPLRTAIRHELQAIRGKWAWLVALGVALIVLGTTLIGFPVISTLATVTMLGALILVAGAAEAVGAFWCREWSGFFLAVLSGTLGVVIGLMLLANPIRGGITLTILLASFLFVGGIFRVVAALAHRVEGWGWLLASGVIDIALGVLIWRELPASGLTIIGLLVGISILFRGVWWLMLGFALRRIPRAAA
ncbi:HdeD family acid-resistance protein [Tautonia plasticadhaerens]|uniref:Acid-resistance membrane protein n=1 Tax=Tautonia plasticadhaerens TaxID=2527974 RepID=A0A518H1Q2_9BACT|nr:HdeD family acid-resistance protein [Tautonia plasticadhaerens]QDV34756.1 acid-resistance membrane protein [Tautonia plasticadhaerens]